MTVYQSVWEIQEAGRIAYDKATTKAERHEVVRLTTAACEAFESQQRDPGNPEARPRSGRGSTYAKKRQPWRSPPMALED